MCEGGMPKDRSQITEENMFSLSISYHPAKSYSSTAKESSPAHQLPTPDVIENVFSIALMDMLHDSIMVSAHSLFSNNNVPWQLGMSYALNHEQCP